MSDLKKSRIMGLLKKHGELHVDLALETSKISCDIEKTVVRFKTKIREVQNKILALAEVETPPQHTHRNRVM